MHMHRERGVSQRAECPVTSEQLPTTNLGLGTCGLVFYVVSACEAVSHVCRGGLAWGSSPAPKLAYSIILTVSFLLCTCEIYGFFHYSLSQQTNWSHSAPSTFTRIPAPHSVPCPSEDSGMPRSAPAATTRAHAVPPVSPSSQSLHTHYAQNSLGFIKTLVWAASKSVWQAESSVPVRRALDETLVTSL